ncbi:DUF6193 family natural product biosynthesis protein [Streptomyces sp. NPDC008137]|uniref:DUF6193 family natural product biosynthesis protein n=1 Tax=Streptomyces sp. NPDC008137 TaxID=3364813 RepID=UPI0036E38781
MENGGDSPSQGHPVIDSALYPDLIELGGLVEALAHIARDYGIDLGPIGSASSSARGHLITAQLISDRGPMLIHLGKERRLFSISIEGERRPWAAGSTDDLATVAKTLDAWRSGVTLRELTSMFPFMEYDELAEAEESGDPVATQWKLLFQQEERTPLRQLLQSVYADARLSALFPYVSMGRFGLTRDHTSRSAGGIGIVPLGQGGYRVEAYPGSERAEAESLEQAVALARAFLDHP